MGTFGSNDRTPSWAKRIEAELGVRKKPDPPPWDFIILVILLSATLILMGIVLKKI